MEEGMTWNLDDLLPINQFDDLYSKIEEDFNQLDKFYDQLNPKASIPKE